MTLFVLFITQVFAEFYVIQTYTDPAQTTISIRILYAYTILYMILGVVLFVKQRASLRGLLDRAVSNASSAMGTGQHEQTD